MFSTKLVNPISPLTKDYLDKEVPVPQGCPDLTLQMLSLAVIKPRVPNFKGFRGWFADNNICEHIVPRIKTEEEVNRHEEEINAKPCLFYDYIAGTLWDFRVFKDTCERNNLKELKLVELYIKQQTNKNVWIYINEKQNRAYVLDPNKDDIRVFHLVMAFIQQLFPVYEKIKPWSAEETDLFKSLTLKTSGIFISNIERMFRPLKKNILKEAMLTGLKSFKEGRITAAMNKIKAAEKESEALIEQYQKKCEELERAKIEYEGLKAVSGDGKRSFEDELIDYVCEKKELHTINYEDGVLRFDCISLLTNFDRKKYQHAVVCNAIYEHYSGLTNVFQNKEARKTLMDALFNNPDPDLVVKIRAGFKLNIRLKVCAVLNDAVGSDPELSNAIPNPHYKLHTCLSSNRTYIDACLKDYDVVGAIESCLAATGNINIAETEYTFRPFVREVLMSKNKVIRRLTDGADLTPEEALLWLQQKEKEKNEEDQTDAGR